MCVIFNNLAANCTPPESPKVHFFFIWVHWTILHKLVYDSLGQRPLAAHGKIWKQKTVGFWFLEYLVSSMHLFSFDFDDIFTYICFIRCTFCIYVSIKMLKVEKISTNKRKCTCKYIVNVHSLLRYQISLWQVKNKKKHKI